MLTRGARLRLAPTCATDYRATAQSSPDEVLHAADAQVLRHRLQQQRVSAPPVMRLPPHHAGTMGACVRDGVVFVLVGAQWVMGALAKGLMQDATSTRLTNGHKKKDGRNQDASLR